MVEVEFALVTLVIVTLLVELTMVLTLTATVEVGFVPFTMLVVIFTVVELTEAMAAAY